MAEAAAPAPAAEAAAPASTAADALSAAALSQPTLAQYQLQLPYATTSAQAVARPRRRRAGFRAIVGWRARRDAAVRAAAVRARARLSRKSSERGLWRDSNARGAPDATAPVRAQALIQQQYAASQPGQQYAGYPGYDVAQYQAQMAALQSAQYQGAETAKLMKHVNPNQRHGWRGRVSKAFGPAARGRGPFASGRSASPRRGRGPP